MKTIALALTLLSLILSTFASEPNITRRYLYVAVPGIRDYLEFGGHGLLVFDIDNNHKFIKRIPTGGVNDAGKPLNVKGVCASAATKRLHISTIKTLQCIDLQSEKLLWEKSYEGGCDRMAISPDGKTIYLPSLEKDHWHVVDALSGDVIKRLDPKSGAHNTLYGPDGKWVYLAGLKSPILSIADTKEHAITRGCGPFANSVRPFTINSKQTLCFVNINELLGFEVGDLVSGKKLHRVEVEGFSKGPIKRHGCPSHGIGLTPDEKELWISDAANERMHIFNLTASKETAPKQVASIKVREQPGWITFSLDGTYAYPSTGDIIDVKSRKILTGLTDENGGPVHSEKMVEVHFRSKDPVRTGDQFGIGRK
jgi:DNA-binding beta-propeller fold protein YncE